MTAAFNRHGRLVALPGVERTRISMAVEFRQQPGWERAPKPPADGGYPFVRGVSFYQWPGFRMGLRRVATIVLSWQASNSSSRM